MNPRASRFWTGIVGIVMFALTLVVILHYFVYSGPPPPRNVLSRLLLNMLALVAMAGWLVGFRNLVSEANSEYEWLGMLCLVFGVVHVVLTMAANSIEGGTVLGKAERIDPTLVGSGGEGALIIYGPVSRLLEAAFLFSAGSAILVTGILPARVAWLAYAVGVLELAFVPTIFAKTNPAEFYSVNGWGIPVAAGMFLTWILVVSVLLVLRSRG